MGSRREGIVTPEVLDTGNARRRTVGDAVALLDNVVGALRYENQLLVEQARVQRYNPVAEAEAVLADANNRDRSHGLDAETGNAPADYAGAGERPVRQAAQASGDAAAEARAVISGMAQQEYGMGADGVFDPNADMAGSTPTPSANAVAEMDRLTTELNGHRATAGEVRNA